MAMAASLKFTFMTSFLTVYSSQPSLPCLVSPTYTLAFRLDHFSPQENLTCYHIWESGEGNPAV